MEHNEKVYSKDDLSGQSKYNMLLKFVKNNAKTLTRKVFTMASTPHDDVNQMFDNVPKRYKLEAIKEFEWNHYLTSEEYRHDIATECITQVGAKLLEVMLIFISVVRLES